MFHRRRGTNPALQPVPSQSATTAAAQAFLANRASNASLSSAAAAAALRSHTTSPIQVGNVQTKRTVRRQNSGASSGSGGESVRGPGGRGLQRQSSSGSMSERTFRDPSPFRAGARAPANDAPPVPSLPAIAPAPQTQTSHRRTVSLDPPVRVTSPVHRVTSGRGVSLDREPALVAGRLAAQRGTGLASVREQELERTGSSSSVNFSRPTIPRSPPPLQNSERPGTSPLRPDQRPGSPASVNVPQMNGTTPMSSMAAKTSQEAGAPVPVKTKKKKKVVPNSSDQVPNGVPTQSMESTPATRSSTVSSSSTSVTVGTDLQQNRASTVPTGPTDTSNVPPVASSTAPEKKRKKKKVAASSMAPPEKTDSSQGMTFYNSDRDSIAGSGDDSASDASKVFTTRPGGLLSKKPSTVREDRELEEKAESSKQKSPRQAELVDQTFPAQTSRLQSLESAMPPPKPKSTAPKKQPGRNAATAGASKKYAETRQHARASSQPTFPAGGAEPGTSMLGDDIRSAGRGQASLRGRPQSLSPSRVAHFSNNPPVTSPNVTKHDPPPRSLSPAKSAMKSSPSPRGSSPAGTSSGPSVALGGKPPSETSDTSLLSEDVRDPDAGKRKKSARVSFDEAPIVVTNGAVSPSSPVAPQLLSPQHKDPARRLFGIGQEKRTGKLKDTGASEDGEDAFLQPRPALPSFGSVRHQKERVDGVEQTEKEKALERSRPQQSPVVFNSVAGDRIDLSSDHVVGSVLSQEFASKKLESSAAPSEDKKSAPDGSQPLPPQVTSVEGSGYVSDSDASQYSTERDEQIRKTEADSIGVENQGKPVVPQPTNSDKEDDTAKAVTAQNDNELPSFALVHPTPILEQDEFLPEKQLPGENAKEHEGLTGDLSDPGTPRLTPASVGLAEPEPEESAINHSPQQPMVGEVAEVLRQQTGGVVEEESDETETSVYSDAAEDLPDLGGDGFMSIDAVVESPVLDSTPGLAISTPPDSPIGKMHAGKSMQKRGLSSHDSEKSEPGAEEGWDKAQAYWSSLSDDRRKQMEQAALSEEDEDTAVPTEPKPKKKKKKKTTKKQAPAATTSKADHADIATEDPPLPPWPVQKARKQKAISGTGAMRTSMRSQEDVDGAKPRMPRSLRDAAVGTKSGGRLSPTAVGNKAPKSSIKKPRPLSAPVMITNSAISAAVSKELRNMPASPTTPSPITVPTKKTQKIVTKPGPRRVNSNASDSSGSASSFRKRRARPSSGEGFSMRTTMRGSSQPSESLQHRRPGSSDGIGTADRSGRYSMRSLSPSGSSNKQSSVLGRGTLRTSMRGSVDSGTPSLRPSLKERTKSPSRFAGFGRSSKAKATSSLATGRRGSGFSDSSDDYDVRRPFRSRFSDSSEEDLPTKATVDLTPVRGIPRRIGEEDGESTDLPDSSEGESSRIATTAAATTKANEGSALASGSLRPKSGQGVTGKDGGNGFVGKAPGQREKKKRSFFGVLGRRKDTAKVQKVEGESGARLDTPLERTKAEIRSSKEIGMAPPTSPTSPTASSRPKLVKKSTAKSSASGSWPLPPTFGVGARPATSDGAPGPSTTERPDLGKRWSTAIELPDAAKQQATVTLPPKEKKKRFQRLRKAFGLDD